jgi:hypothetical protein
MFLLCIKLASFVGSGDVLGIDNSYHAVETFSKGFSHQCVGSDVVAATPAWISYNSLFPSSLDMNL